MNFFIRFPVLILVLFLASCSSKVVPTTIQNESFENSLLIILVDKSGSMRHEKKIEFARAAALDAVAELGDADVVSIVGFDHAPFILIEAQEVASARELIENRIKFLVPVGKTNLLPSLMVARQILKRHPEYNKHVLLLSDGKIPAPPELILEEVSRIRNTGASISTVTLGKDVDRRLMLEIARRGNGTFYATARPARLPAVFVDDVKNFLGK